MRRRTLRTGTTVVTVTFKNIKTAKSTAKKYRCVVKAALEQKPEEPATKAAKITAIKQTSATKLAAEFSADMTGIKYTDLKIVRDETGAVVTVKSATVDKTDATKVTIETYEALTDGKAYTVTYTAADEAKTESNATFTATAGVVADIALNTYSVPANTPTELKYQLLDANGVLLEEKGIGKSRSDKIDVSIENFNGYQDDNKVTLYKVGDKATMKVVYHTWKYNNTDGTEEGKVEKTFDITAVDPSTVIETYEYSVATKNAVVDFKRDTLKKQIAVDDDKTVTDLWVHFYFCKADGTEITNSLDYTVSSGNENVLLASGSVADGAQLTPVAAGATYLVIKNSAGAVVKTLPITVVAKREMSTMTVDNSHVTISKDATTAIGAQKITVAVMDQYSDAYSAFTAKNLELKSGDDTKQPDVQFDTTPATGKNKIGITVKAKGATDAGTYTYTLDLEDTNKSTNVKKITFSVTVSKVLDSKNDSFALVLENANGNITSKVDTTVGTDAYSNITLNPVIVVKNNGVITGKASTADIVSIGAMTLKKGSTTVDSKKGTVYDVNEAAGQINSGVIKVAYGNGSNAANAIVKNLDAGTYTLTLSVSIDTDTVKDGKADKVIPMSTSFQVEDSQKVFGITVKKESVTDITALSAIFDSSNTDYVTFSYAGHELDSRYPYSFADADYTKYNNGSINVKKVSVDVNLPGTDGKYVRMTTNVNRTFTFNKTITLGKDEVTATVKSFKADYVSGSAMKDTLNITSKAALVDEADDVIAAINALPAAQQTAFADDLTLIQHVKAEAQADIDDEAQANANQAVAAVTAAALNVTGTGAALKCNFIVQNAKVTVVASAGSISTSSAITTATADVVSTLTSTGSFGFSGIAGYADGETITVRWLVTAEGTVAGTTVTKPATGYIDVTYKVDSDGETWIKQ